MSVRIKMFGHRGRWRLCRVAWFCLELAVHTHLVCAHQDPKMSGRTVLCELCALLFHERHQVVPAV
jgi:hypothetical protein